MMVNQLKKRAWLRIGWSVIGLPMVIYMLAAVFITWPLITQLSSHVAGAGYGDGFEYIRLGWWAKYALQHGLNPFYQSLFGYPQGFSSAVQLAQPLIYWPITLLSYVVDLVAAFNLWLLLEAILSGLTAYWLCLAILDQPDNTSARLAAIFGGLIFMAFPAAQGHLSAGHVNPLANYALPIIGLALYRMVEGRGNIRIAVLGAVALWIAALGNFTFPIFTLLPLILFGGGYWFIARRKQLFKRITLQYLILMFGGGLALSLPFYLPLLTELSASDRPVYLQETGWVRYSTDPLGFIAPSPFTPWTRSVAPTYSRAVLGTNSIEGTAYLGIVATVLAGIAVIRRRRAAVLWLIVALGCMLFSLGPLLKWQDQPLTYTLGNYSSHIVLPWALFQNLPLIDVTRTPGRFNITTGLALGVLAALGLNVVLSIVPRRSWRIALWIILISATLAEYQLFFPFLTTPAALPSYFNDLAQRDDVRATFDVPWDDLLAQKAALYQQTAHHKPLLAGYVSRFTPVDQAKLALLSDIATSKAFLAPLTSDQARTVLKANGVDVLVYHWGLLDKTAILHWASAAFGPPAYQDDQTAIFNVPSPEHPSDEIALTRSSSGWWQPSQSTSSDPLWLSGTAGMSSDSIIYLYTSKSIDQQWTFQVTPLIKSRTLRLTVDGQFDRAWLINPPTQTVDLWLQLAPGFHSLRFNSSDGCVPVPIAPMCILNPTAGQQCQLPDNVHDLCVGMAFTVVQSREAGAMAFQEHRIQLSNGMLMQGFRVPGEVQAGTVLPVQTEWQASEKLPGDYHFFVHLIDLTGRQVAQSDGIPGDGTYPTLDWLMPQAWIVNVGLPLPADLPPGMYSLYAGWYRFPDLTRLGVEGSSPGAKDGLVFLRDVTIR